MFYFRSTLLMTYGLKLCCPPFKACWFICVSSYSDMSWIYKYTSQWFKIAKIIEAVLWSKYCYCNNDLIWIFNAEINYVLRQSRIRYLAFRRLSPHNLIFGHGVCKTKLRICWEKRYMRGEERRRVARKVYFGHPSSPSPLLSSPLQT